MAVTVSHLTSATTTTFPAVTASVSPSGEVLIFLQCGDADGVTVSSISGNGLTWSEVRANTTNWGGGNFRDFIWKGIGTASSGAITVTFSVDPGTLTYQVCNVSGHSTSGMVVQSNAATGSSTAPSVTLSAFADSGNATVGWVCVAAGSTNTVTPGSGFTELDEIRRASFTVDCATEWRNDNDTTVDCSLSGTKTWYMFGFEIAVAAAGGGSTAAAESDGVGTATASGASTATSPMSSTGAALATATGAAQAEATINASGASTATAVGSSEDPGIAAEGDASSTGAATAEGYGESSATTVISSSGISVATGEGTSESSAVISSDGVSTAEMVGEAAAEGASAASAAGTSLATAEGMSTASAEMESDGAGTATAVGAGGATITTSGGWDKWAQEQRKQKAQQELVLSHDEEDIAVIAQALAFMLKAA